MSDPLPRLSALAEPTITIARRWVGCWTVAVFGAFMAYYATQQILLPRHANAIAGGDNAVAVAATSYAGIAAAVVAIVVSILAGRLSDRTLHRRGRRQVWVIGGALLAGAAFVVQGTQTTVAGLVIAWAIFQVGYNTLYTALLAAVPDEVPVNERATVSGFQAVAQASGPLAGIALVSLLLTGIIDAYVGLAIFLIVLVLPFAFGTRGIRLRAEERPAPDLRATLAGIVRPLRHADFAWAFGQRFMIQLSNALGLLFLYQYLKDAVGVDPDVNTLILSGIYTVAVCVVAIPAGRLSDRTMKRKRMVILSSVLMGLAGLTLAIWHTLPTAMIGAATLGLGIGCYQAVDQALITQVLPSAEDRGKDLGVIQIANVLPAVFAAAIGGLLINAYGFGVLYAAMVVTGLAAALLVAPIKSVR